MKEVQRVLPSVEQERNILREKIRIVEERDGSLVKEHQKLKAQLETMIADNSILKERMEHLGQLYEEKLKEGEELIAEFREAEGELNQKDLEIQ